MTTTTTSTSNQKSTSRANADTAAAIQRRHTDIAQINCEAGLAAAHRDLIRLKQRRKMSSIKISRHQQQQKKLVVVLLTGDRAKKQ